MNKIDNVAFMHQMLLELAIHNPSLLKSLTLFTDKLVMPPWTALSCGPSSPNMRKTVLEKVQELEGKKVAHQLLKEWIPLDAFEFKTGNISFTEFIITTSHAACSAFVFSKLGEYSFHEMEFLSIDLFSLVCSNVLGIPLVISVDGFFNDFNIEAIKYIQSNEFVTNFSKQFDESSKRLDLKISPNAKENLMFYMKNIIHPFSKIIPTADSLHAAQQTVNIEVPDLNSLTFDEILWLKHKNPRTRQFPNWISTQMQEKGITIQHATNGQISEVLSDVIWDMIYQIKPNPKMTIMKGIISNIPVPFPLNPLGIATLTEDVMTSFNLENKFGGIFLLAELKKLIKTP